MVLLRWFVISTQKFSPNINMCWSGSNILYCSEFFFKLPSRFFCAYIFRYFHYKHIRISFKNPACVTCVLSQNTHSLFISELSTFPEIRPRTWPRRPQRLQLCSQHDYRDQGKTSVTQKHFFLRFVFFFFLWNTVISSEQLKSFKWNNLRIYSVGENLVELLTLWDRRQAVNTEGD